MTLENREPLNDNGNKDGNSTESTKNYGCNVCCSLMLLPLAIAAVVVAVMHPIYWCSGRYFGINAEIFLYVAGCINIVWFTTRLLINCCSYGCKDEKKWQCKKYFECAHYLISVFNLVWGAIGLYIWMNKMDRWCQKSSVGIMILLWCCIVLFCICVTICFWCWNRKTLIEMTKAEGTKCDDIDDNESKEGNETLV